MSRAWDLLVPAGLARRISVYCSLNMGNEMNARMESVIRAQLSAHRSAINCIEQLLLAHIEAAALRITRALASGKKLLAMGNGGSAADSQHLVAEIVGRYVRERRGYPAVALTTDTSILTALGNDYGFDQVFRRQVEALAAPGDVVLGISTSGNSSNVVAAMELARRMGCVTIGLAGRDGGEIAKHSDVALVVPVAETARVQEAHITIIHILCELVDAELPLS